MNFQETAIQPRFRNKKHRAVVNILYTSKNVATRLQKMLADYDLTLQQYNILRIVYRQHPEPACNCTIREQMLDSRSDITRIVDRLIKEDLVTRTSCRDDRRKVSIRITEKGVRVIEDMDDLHERMDGIMKTLTEQELDVFNRLLDKVRVSKK